MHQEIWHKEYKSWAIQQFIYGDYNKTFRVNVEFEKLKCNQRYRLLIASPHIMMLITKNFTQKKLYKHT
jgi:hypothetical protein